MKIITTIILACSASAAFAWGDDNAAAKASAGANASADAFGYGGGGGAGGNGTGGNVDMRGFNLPSTFSPQSRVVPGIHCVESKVEGKTHWGWGAYGGTPEMRSWTDLDCLQRLLELQREHARLMREIEAPVRPIAPVAESSAFVAALPELDRESRMAPVRERARNAVKRRGCK